MKKRLFIVHGWGGRPEGDWLPWLKKEIESDDFEVFVLSMPDSFHPKIEAWVNFLAESVGQPDANTYLVGHSIGCQTILRYLETLQEDEKVGGVVLVASWLHLTDETWDEDYTPEIAAPWLNSPIDFEKIKLRSEKFVAIQSDDDPYVPLSDAKIFEEKLGAKIIIENKKGHIAEEDGVTNLPSALSAIIELSS